MSNLYVVATPIGNLEDITFRAVRILSEVSLIAAEDTRHTKILLDKYNIKTPLSSYHKFNIRGKTAYFIERLKAGEDIALVSDAGTPGISDPGVELIQSAIKEGISVVSIPGASAVISALAVSGLDTEKFLFIGFLPKKPGKARKVLKELSLFDGTIIIYESPYRILKTLEAVNTVLGDRKVAVVRELTKKFEEIIRGSALDVIKSFEGKTVKGEIVLLVEGKKD